MHNLNNLTPEKQFELAVDHQRNGRLQEAEATYRALLQHYPGHLDVTRNLSQVLITTGRAGEALALWNQFILRTGSSLSALLQRAQAAIAAGASDQATADLEKCRSAASRDEEWRQIAGVAVALRRYDLAVDAFQEALRLGPNEPRNFSGFASLCNELGDYALAAEIAGGAIKLDSDSGAGWLELGNALMHQGDYAGAAHAFLTLAELQPNSADAYCNLGLIHQEAMAHEEALQCFDEALQRAPEHAMARWNRSLSLLALGRLEAAWPDYELRRHLSVQGIKQWPTYPEWEGQPLDGKTIVLLHEQGLGDSLQFIRYAPLLAERGARVLVRVPPPLVRLFSHVPGVSQALSDQEAMPAGDYFCPMLSLPLRFGTTLSSIPAALPYLAATEADIHRWQQRLPANGKLKVGLVWAGGQRLHHAAATRLDERRSLTLAQLAPILDCTGVDFVSLQVGGKESEISSGKYCQRIADFAADITDMADTAALIRCLDLVISVDTSVAHLAAGLNTPVWLLNRFDSDWRWLMDRTDCPWYPGLRQFRQPLPGDWESVLTAVRQALSEISPVKLA